MVLPQIGLAHAPDAPHYGALGAGVPASPGHCVAPAALCSPTRARPALNPQIHAHPVSTAEDLVTPGPPQIRFADRAVVVGVNKYAGLTHLRGAEADAKAFRDWLVSHTGGGLQKSMVTTILSSDFPDPAHPAITEPLLSTVNGAFARLIWEGRQSGGQLGRRLYIFLAGHGIARDYEDSSLLTAEATYDDTAFNIPGRSYANWFMAAAFFEEVVLIMDCCRSPAPASYSQLVPWAPMERHGARVRSAFAFATKWSYDARERYFEEFGSHRGIFSVALLEALQGAALTTGTQAITTGSLDRYMRHRLPMLCRKGHVQDAKFVYDDLDDIVFTGDAHELPGRVFINSNTWPPISVFDHKHREVLGEKFQDGTWTAVLTPGCYRVQEEDGHRRTREFEVLPRGETHVEF